jgi:hypothetical protein
MDSVSNLRQVGFDIVFNFPPKRRMSPNLDSFTPSTSLIPNSNKKFKIQK